MSMAVRQSSLDDLFTNEGKLKRKTKLSQFFLRPAYQYTIAELGNNNQKDFKNRQTIQN